MAKLLVDRASLQNICWFCGEALLRPAAFKAFSRPRLSHTKARASAKFYADNASDRRAPKGLRTADTGLLPSAFEGASKRSVFRGIHSLKVRAMSSGKGSLLAGVSKDHVDSVARVLEVAEDACNRWEVAHTDFLDPLTREAALTALKNLADCSAVVSGGYPQAERCRLSVGRPDMLEISGTSESELREVLGAVAAIDVKGNFMFDPAAHPDFLGAILNTGVVRGKVGDILVQGERGAQILVVPEMVDFFKDALKTVRTVPVTVEEVPLSDLRVRPPKVDTIRTFEASLRVDAIGSAGFRMSRSKLVDMIESKQVRVNWKDVTKSGSTVKTGDVISVRGKGRIEVGDIAETKKGRFQVELTRYL